MYRMVILFTGAELLRQAGLATLAEVIEPYTDKYPLRLIYFFGERI